MKRHLLSLAVMLLGCSPAAVWKPPPASEIPVAPRPDEMRRSIQVPKEITKALVHAIATPEPMSGELPKDLDAKLIVHAVCKDKECLVPGLYPSGAAADGGAPAAIWSHDLPEKGFSLTFPKHAGVDLFGLVLSGAVKIKPLEPGAKTKDLRSWEVFRAPGAGASVIAVDGAARLVLAIAGEAGPIAETIAQLKDRKLSKKALWKSRPFPVEFIDLKSQPDLSWAGGAVHARIGFESGRASFGLLFASRDAPVAPHIHENSWEILAALSADGTARRASSMGATEMSEFAVTDGTIVAMPKGLLHAWVPGGKKPLLAVQMYLPPGPEQRFKKLANP